MYQAPASDVWGISQKRAAKSSLLQGIHVLMEGGREKIAFIGNLRNLRKTCKRLRDAITYEKIILGRSNSQCESPKTEAYQARPNRFIAVIPK